MFHVQVLGLGLGLDGQVLGLGLGLGGQVLGLGLDLGGQVLGGQVFGLGLGLAYCGLDSKSDLYCTVCSTFFPLLITTWYVKISVIMPWCVCVIILLLLLALSHC